MRPSMARLTPALAAVWASFLSEWQQVGRQRVRWVAIMVNIAVVLLPLLLAQRAFGSEGFAASGGGEHVVAFIALGWLAMQVAHQTLLGAEGYLRQANETGVLPHLWTTRVARWVPVVGITLFELVQMLVWTGVILAVVLISVGGLPAVSVLAIPAIALSVIGFFGIGLAMAGAGNAAAAVARAGIGQRHPVSHGRRGLSHRRAAGRDPLAELRPASHLRPGRHPPHAAGHAHADSNLGRAARSCRSRRFIGGVGGIAVFNRLDRYAARRGLVGLYT